MHYCGSSDIRYENRRHGSASKPKINTLSQELTHHYISTPRHPTIYCYTAPVNVSDTPKGLITQPSMHTDTGFHDTMLHLEQTATSAASNFGIAKSHIQDYTTKGPKNDYHHPKLDPILCFKAGAAKKIQLQVDGELDHSVEADESCLLGATLYQIGCEERAVALRSTGDWGVSLPRPLRHAFHK